MYFENNSELNSKNAKKINIFTEIYKNNYKLQIKKWKTSECVENF